MSQLLHLYKPLINPRNLSVFLIWLFHLSAVIGISLGFEHWFISKTPVTLTLIFVLLVWSFPEKDLKLVLGIVVFFFGGMFVEWIGVHYGFPFGVYSYGDNLGPKVSGVPWFIGINWAVLTLICGIIASHLVGRKWLRILAGAGLMVFLDFFLEFSAPIFDFWAFENEAVPIENYLAWFGISVLFHFIYQSLKIKGDTKISYHLYAAQLVFFVYFYGFYSL